MNNLKRTNRMSTIEKIENWDQGSSLITLGGCVVKYVNDTISSLLEIEAKHYWRRPTIPLMSSPISGVTIPDSFSAGLTAYVHDDLKKNQLNQLTSESGILFFDLTRDIFGDFFNGKKSAFANPYTMLGLELNGASIKVPEVADYEYFSAQGFIPSSCRDENFFPIWHTNFFKFVEKLKGKYKLVLLENFFTDRAYGIDGQYFAIDRAYVSNANQVLEKLFDSAKKFVEIETIKVPHSMLVSGSDVIYGGPSATHYSYQTLDWITKEFAQRFLLCNDVVENWYQSRLMQYAEQYYRKNDGLTVALANIENSKVESSSLLENNQTQLVQISSLEERCGALLKEKDILDSRVESHTRYALEQQSHIQAIASEKDALLRENTEHRETILNHAALVVKQEESIRTLTTNKAALEIEIVHIKEAAEKANITAEEKSTADLSSIQTLSAQISNLEERCRTLLREKDILDSRVESHTRYALEQQSHIQAIAAEKDALLRDNSDYKETILNHAALVLKQKESISTLTANNAALEMEIAHIKEVAEKVNKKAEEKPKEDLGIIQTQSAQISNLEERCRTLTKEKEILDSRVASHTQYALEQQSRLQALSAEKEALLSENIVYKKILPNEAALEVKIVHVKEVAKKKTLIKLGNTFNKVRHSIWRKISAY